MLFSERMGYKKVKDIVQVDNVDEELRNSLWNVYYTLMGGEELNKAYKSTEIQKKEELFFENIWGNYWKLRYDEVPYQPISKFNFIKQYFFNCKWWEVYDLLEYIIKNCDKHSKSGFIHVCNASLETYLSAYRFIGEHIAPIPSEEQISAVQKALDFASQSKMYGIYTHLESALQKLSHKTDPDYRNSIKESISAVESLAQIITNDPKAELGKALKIIKDKIGLHGALEKGFSNIYGYTSDSDGIRHALLEKSNLDQEDAIYMLVSCSAFINYLVVKSTKAGIDI